MWSSILVSILYITINHRAQIYESAVISFTDRNAFNGRLTEAQMQFFLLEMEMVSFSPEKIAVPRHMDARRFWVINSIIVC